MLRLTRYVQAQHKFRSVKTTTIRLQQHHQITSRRMTPQPVAELLQLRGRCELQSVYKWGFRWLRPQPVLQKFLITCPVYRNIVKRCEELGSRWKLIPSCVSDTSVHDDISLPAWVGSKTLHSHLLLTRCTSRWVILGKEWV